MVGIGSFESEQFIANLTAFNQASFAPKSGFSELRGAVLGRRIPNADKYFAGWWAANVMAELREHIDTVTMQKDVKEAHKKYLKRQSKKRRVPLTDRELIDYWQLMDQMDTGHALMKQRAEEMECERLFPDSKKSADTIARMVKLIRVLRRREIEIASLHPRALIVHF